MIMFEIEEPYIEMCRRMIEEQYSAHPTFCGSSFGEILCYELHENRLTFYKLGKKWGLPVSIVGELIYDHCKKLEELPKVTF